MPMSPAHNPKFGEPQRLPSGFPVLYGHNSANLDSLYQNWQG